MGMLAGAFCTLLAFSVMVTGRSFFKKPVGIAESKGSDVSKTESSKKAISKKPVEQKAAELADLIDEYYYEKIDQQAMVEGMYAGMVEGLGDPYTAYYTKEEYAALNESTTGIYYGIGTVLTQDKDTKIVSILHVYPGTPAEEAGLRDGDVISKVGEIEADSMELSELTSHIKGEKGTKVHLEIVRAGENGYLGFDVERRQI